MVRKTTSQTPVVDRAGRRMPAGTLGSQHRHNPRDGAHEPRATCTATTPRNKGEDDGIGMPKTTTPWSGTVSRAHAGTVADIFCDHGPSEYPDFDHTAFRATDDGLTSPH